MQKPAALAEAGGRRRGCCPCVLPLQPTGQPAAVLQAFPASYLQHHLLLVALDGALSEREDVLQA